jgi:hypothetical protein
MGKGHQLGRLVLVTEAAVQRDIGNFTILPGWIAQHRRRAFESPLQEMLGETVAGFLQQQRTYRGVTSRRLATVAALSWPEFPLVPPSFRWFNVMQDRPVQCVFPGGPVNSSATTPACVRPTVTI